MADAGPGTPAGPFKPRLKINISRSASFVTDTPPSALAASTPGEGAARKVKLKVSGSTPATPAGEQGTPVKTKAGRQPKPTQKLVESKKRQRDDEDDEDDLARRTSLPPATKIKIRPLKMGGGRSGVGGGGVDNTHTQVVLKARGRPPVHPPGDGYDSEASDRELDPAIEEQFILRMVPGEHSDYVRTMMETGKIGVNRQAGGASLSLKFFDEESHRAVVTVKGQMFAAVMVDLPTITESMKTWDKKSFLKSADICQMLLVFQPVKTEEEAKRAALPAMMDSASFKWPHGLTPPMHDCVNRRFAKTISRKEIEDKETEVERLLSEDAMADRTAWEWVDEVNDGANGGEDDDDEDAEGEDAEGELDDSMGYFGDGAAAGGEEDDFDLEADLEAAFADDMVADTPATGMDFGTPVMTTQANTPAAGLHQSIEMDESDESDDDDDDDDDDDEDLDEDQRAARDEQQGVKDIINDLKKQLNHRRADLEKTQNKILRQRLESQIKQLKSEIELKMSSIGMEMDD